MVLDPRRGVLLLSALMNRAATYAVVAQMPMCMPVDAASCVRAQ